MIAQRCPHCGDTRETVNNATVTHRCPQNRNRTSTYVRVEAEGQTRMEIE